VLEWTPGGCKKGTSVAANNIAEVLTALDRIIAAFRAQGRRLAFFPALYRAVTLRVQAGIVQGEFADGARMDRLDTAFANRYFAALDALQAGGEPPRAWQVAFSAENRAGLMILQHLLLGVNGHINFDLPIAVVAVAAGGTLPDLRGDFDAINAILGALLDPVQSAIERYSPLLTLLDRVGGRSDEQIVNFSLQTARDEAWHEATRLAGEPDAQRERSGVSLDRRVALLGERILLPGGLVGSAIDLISHTESDDVSSIVDGLLAVR
jgi:hypothetical protein